MRLFDGPGDREIDAGAMSNNQHDTFMTLAERAIEVGYADAKGEFPCRTPKLLNAPPARSRLGHVVIHSSGFYRKC